MSVWLSCPPKLNWALRPQWHTLRTKNVATLSSPLMNSVRRIISLSSALALLAACDDTSAKSTGPNDEDQSLALSVMTARGDTLLPPIDSPIILDDVAPVRV